MSINSDSPNSAPLTVKIAESIAEVRDEDVEELPPIGYSFDTGALGRFINSTSVPTTVTMELYECRVMINDSGVITTTDTNGSA